MLILVIAECIGSLSRYAHVGEHALEFLSELESPCRQLSDRTTFRTHISTLSFATMPFSASSEALLPYKSRRARWFL